MSRIDPTLGDGEPYGFVDVEPGAGTLAKLDATGEKDEQPPCWFAPSYPRDPRLAILRAMKDLARQLSEAHAEVFAALGIDTTYSALTRSNRPDLGEFQSNGALAVAKATGRQPREIAEAAASRWSATEIAEEVAYSTDLLWPIRHAEHVGARGCSSAGVAAKAARCRNGDLTVGSRLQAGRTDAIVSAEVVGLRRPDSVLPF